MKKSNTYTTYYLEEDFSVQNEKKSKNPFSVV